MARTIAVLSQKGGTGKTTTVRNLADCFRRRGIRTLAIDLDPQGNLSEYFDAVTGGPTIADVLRGQVGAAEAIRQDLIPADLTLAEVELLLAGRIGREMRLRRALAEVTGAYGLVLIDCPPSLGLLTVNGLVAADWALITAEAQYFALRGVEQAIEVVELARDTLNPALSLLGILVNRANMRTVHSRAALGSLRARYGTAVLETAVRSSIAYAESAQRTSSVLDYRPDLGRDYLAIAEELLGRLGSAADAAKPELRLGRDRHGARTVEPGTAAPAPAVAVNGLHELGLPTTGNGSSAGEAAIVQPLASSNPGIAGEAAIVEPAGSSDPEVCAQLARAGPAPAPLPSGRS